jgi:hypothetical protein
MMWSYVLLGLTAGLLIAVVTTPVGVSGAVFLTRQLAAGTLPGVIAGAALYIA